MMQKEIKCARNSIKKGVAMNYKQQLNITYNYELNLDVIEFCIVTNNCRRWSGIDEQIKVLQNWKGKVNDLVYELMAYGLSLMIDGRDPALVEFYVNEYVAKRSEDHVLNHAMKRDLRLVQATIVWIQNGEGHRVEELLSTIENSVLRSEYKNWLYLNQFDFYLKREDFRKMSTADINELTQSKPYIAEAFMKGRQG
jgi:hypothetical protein